MFIRISAFGKRLAVPLATLGVVLVGALAVGARSGTAAAAQPAQTSVVVRVGDLDLSTQEGVATLHRRIDSAAWRVCSAYEASHPLDRALLYRNCVRATADNALEKVQRALNQVQWEVR
jgi:UrcA family protein